MYFRYPVVSFAARHALRRKTNCAHTQQSPPRNKSFRPPQHQQSIVHPSLDRSLAFADRLDVKRSLRNMLLPSALPCDVRRPSRFAASRLLTTPPPSDDDVPSGNGLLGTCRALQSLLNGSPAPSPRSSKPARLQSPLQIRSTPSSTRSRKLAPPSSPKQTTPQRSHGANKRRRGSFEADDDTINNLDMDDSGASCDRFSTPKRRRHVPYDLPLGLSQSDFYSLHSPPITASLLSPRHHHQQSNNAQTSTRQAYDPDAALPSIEKAEETAQPDPWTAEDDQRLVEAVLEKFQLSRRDWDECAQRVGRDHASVGRRWQALVGEGNVGLRRGRRMVRGRIDEMWR